MTISARFSIGEQVRFRIFGGPNCGVEIICYVRAITFTSSKVRYALHVPCGEQPDTLFGSEGGTGMTLHNVDSCFVHPGDGSVTEFQRDNYS